MPSGDQADFVIIGAGSAGCALAERLTRSGRFSVILIEAGPSDQRLSLQVPLGYGMSFYDPAVNWMYWSDPVPGLGGRSVYVPRGRVVGGSSAINAMVYVRGFARDFDDWEAAGNSGWNGAEVARLYDEIERNDLPVTDMSREAHETCDAFFAATTSLGIDRLENINNGGKEGVGYYPVTIAEGLRLSASRAFLHPALRRRNLTLITNAMVSRIIFAGRRAAAVAYNRAGQDRLAKAGREILLCAGAINSPQILQLSGIGPASRLQELGVPVLYDCPAVGENLQDHLGFDVTFRALVPTLNEELGPLVPRFFAALRYLISRRGPLAGSLSHAGGFLRSRPDRPVPNIQLYFCPSSYDRAAPRTRKLTRPDPFPGFSLCISNCRPASLGYVRIKSANPSDAPAIQPDFLASEADMEEMREGSSIIDALAATPALSSIIARRVDEDTASNERSAQIRASGYSAFHPCGTCRMGPDPVRNVVDPQLRVHGVSGLRVIDASIFPNITSGNINAPSMMVGVKGALIILDDLLANSWTSCAGKHG